MYIVLSSHPHPPTNSPLTPHTIPSSLCSTTDAHVALQQLSHHVPYQVLPPNGGERKWGGGGRIWVEREEGRVLYLDGRDRVMNINFCSFFYHQKGTVVYVVIMCFALSWLSAYIHRFLLHPRSLIVSVSGLYLSDSPSLSFSFGSGFGRGGGQRPCPPPVTGSSWTQSREGGNRSQKAHSYWCSRLTTLVVTNNQKRHA